MATKRTSSKRSLGSLRLLAVLSGLFVGILMGLVNVAIDNRQAPKPASTDFATMLQDVDCLSADETQTLILKALSKLEEQRALGAGANDNGDLNADERTTYSRQDVKHGFTNLRRLLPSVKGWTLEVLREATTGYGLKQSEWQRVTRLVNGVSKIVRTRHILSMAAIRDDRLSEILVDPSYAPYLISEDEAVFVLAHELTHVAARSGKLDRFIQGVAEHSKHVAQVEPTEDQIEDLACDVVGERVLKRFVTINPTNDSFVTRISTVVGYETPARRFARAWQDFCVSYNGDPGDRSHLNQYQTIRALVAIDPELQSLMQTGDSVLRK